MHEADGLAGAQRALEDPAQHDDAAVRVVLGVEDERLQRGFRVALRRGELRDDAFEKVVDPGAGLRRAVDRLEGIEAEIGIDLLRHAVDVRRGQVDLVDHRQDLEVVLEREIEVGDGLRLDPLRGIDEQQRAFAGHQRAAHLVREVDVAGRVDQVEPIALAVRRVVEQRDRVALDRDAPLALDVHGVEQLITELAISDRTAALDQAVGEGRLAMIDVRDDAEVPRSLEAFHDDPGEGERARPGAFRALIA